MAKEIGWGMATLSDWVAGTAPFGDTVDYYRVAYGYLCALDQNDLEFEYRSEKHASWVLGVYTGQDMEHPIAYIPGCRVQGVALGKSQKVAGFIEVPYDRELQKVEMRLKKKQLSE